MDIVLATETENPFLALQQIERFNDGSGYASKLSVRSGWLSFSISFFFEEDPLTRFLGSLKEMDEALIGTAILKPDYEPQFIKFTMDQLGHVKVEGDLIEHGMNDQRVLFRFITDQTCLKPFIKGIEAMQGLKQT